MRYAGRLRLLLLTVIVVSILLLVRALPTDRVVATLEGRVDRLGPWAPLAFGFFYVVGALFFVPGAALTLAAGALFGLLWGTVTVSFASVTTAGLAFLIARYVARRRVEDVARRHPGFDAVDRAIGERGWRIIALLRLSPAIPFSLSNYLFGLTSIRFLPYLLASWIFMLPGTFLYVYLGHVGRAGAEAASPLGSSRTAGEWALLLVGIGATIAVTVYVTAVARRAVRERMAASPVPKEEPMPQTAARTRGVAALAVLTLLLAGCAVLATLKRESLRGLFGPPPVELREAYAEDPRGPTFDHSALSALLREHVDADGWVDYAGLKKEEAALDRYLQALAKAPIDDMGRSERLALLVNAYNAFTMKLILDRYPVESIKSVPAGERWDGRTWKLGGHDWTLNQIEHDRIRAKFREPRVHFALNCASVGCPPLRREAYSGPRLEEQLEDQARYCHRHDRWFRYDPEGDVLHLTALYDWYGSDFTQVAGSVAGFAARYSGDLSSAMKAGRAPRVRFMDYDWKLNSRENR